MARPSRRGAGGRGWLPPVLLSLSLGLLLAAWVMGNPPSWAPDEPDHYVKALGAGQGQLLGEHLDVSPLERDLVRRSFSPDIDPARREQLTNFTLLTSRRFTIPMRLISPAFGCNAGRVELSAACLEGRGLNKDARASMLANRRSKDTGKPFSHVGTYQPFLYVPAGLLMRAEDDPNSALRLGRVALAAISLVLLVMAIFALWEPRTRVISLLGLIVAVTPMVVFQASTLSASGPEIAAGICFAAALIRLLRDGPQSRLAWAALAAGGSVLGLARPLGSAFVVLIVAALVALTGPRAAVRRLTGRGAALAAWLVVAAGMGAGAFWELAYEPHPSAGLGEVLGYVPSAAKVLPSVLRQGVGTFGALDSPLPVPAYITWLILLTGLLAVALRVSVAGDRLRLVALTLGIVAAVVAIGAVHRQTSFLLQGRYVLPIAVVIPLWAGELLRRGAWRLPQTSLNALALGATTLAAIVQAVAWYVHARRSAVGTDGAWSFPLDPDWSPPAGWGLWLCLWALATGCYVLAGVTGGRLLRWPARPRVGSSGKVHSEREELARQA